MSLNINEKIDLFQLKNQLVIPNDLVEYFKLTNDEIDAYNLDMFVFYKFDEFKSVKEEVGNFGGIPDYRKIVQTLPFHESCFVFAEWMIHSAVYAIRLNNDNSYGNEIYAISGHYFEVVANSFTDFLEIYKKDFNDILI
jgi:hypothetical protein